MKQVEFSYHFADGDVDALLFTLSVLPELRMEESETQANINAQLCASAIEKLINRVGAFSSNEYRVMISSLMAAKLILSGDLAVDKETMTLCQKYALTINKLSQHFSSPSEGYVTLM